MMNSGFKIVVVVLAFALISLSAAAKPVLYVQNGQSNDMSVISIPGHEVVSVFSTGEHSDDVIASSDGKVLYVNLGNRSNHSWGFPEGGEIVAISTKTEKIGWRVSIDGWPHHLSLSNDDRYLFVPLFDRAYVAVIDTQKREITGRLDAQWGMHGTRISPDGKRLYAGSIFTQSLYILDIASNKPSQIINFKEGVRPFAFNKAETVLYAQQSRLHGFEVVDLAQGKVVETIHLPGLPADWQPPEGWPHNVNHGLELSPNEQYLLAAGSVLDMVAVYTHPELQLVAQIPVGHDPNWIVFSPDSKFAYVSCRGSDEISIISMDSLEEIKRLHVKGKFPSRMRVVDVP